MTQHSRHEQRLRMAQLRSAGEVRHLSLFEFQDLQVLQILARNSGIAQSVQDRLLQESLSEEGEGLCLILAENPGISPATQRTLLTWREEGANIKCALARNPRLDPEVACILAKDPMTVVRRVLALHFPLNSLLAEMFAVDEAISVRVSLAERKRLPSSAACLLAGDENLVVRTALAFNTSLDVDDSFPLSFLKDFRMTNLTEMMAPIPAEVWKPLAENWEGSARDLREACSLF